MAMTPSSAITKAWFCAVFTGVLMLLCSSQAQAQAKKIYPNDGNIEYIKITSSGKDAGLEIKLTSAGIKFGLTVYGSGVLTRNVISQAEKADKVCRSIKFGKLANQIQLHAWAYTFYFERNHANPVNVTWAELF
jgi:hypothetical protein